MSLSWSKDQRPKELTKNEIRVKTGYRRDRLECVGQKEELKTWREDKKVF